MVASTVKNGNDRFGKGSRRRDHAIVFVKSCILHFACKCFSGLQQRSIGVEKSTRESAKELRDTLFWWWIFYPQLQYFPLFQNFKHTHNSYWLKHSKKLSKNPNTFVEPMTTTLWSNFWIIQDFLTRFGRKRAEIKLNENQGFWQEQKNNV